MGQLGWLVAWRAVWAVASRSYYVPDETWQSVEVACTRHLPNGLIRLQIQQKMNNEFCLQVVCWVVHRAVTVPGTRYFVRYQVLQPCRNGSSTVRTVPGTTWYFYGTLKRE